MSFTTAEYSSFEKIGAIPCIGDCAASNADCIAFGQELAEIIEKMNFIGMRELGMSHHDFCGGLAWTGHFFGTRGRFVAGDGIPG